MPYLGNTPEQQAFTPAIDYFSGNGSTTAFTLSRPVASVAQVQAVIENVPQNPGTAFTVSGNTITFDGAPPSGTNNIYVYYTSPITTVATLSQDPVVTGSMTFSSSGARIRGDMSNATQSNRFAFQTSTTNGATTVSVLPNGTSAVSAVQLVNNSNPENAGRVLLSITDTVAAVNSTTTGSGTALPLTLNTGGSERLRIDTSGNVGIGTSSPISGFRLDVQGGDFRVGDDANQGFEAGYSAGGSQAFVQGYNRGTSAFIDMQISAATLKFGTGSSATERMRIDSNGRVTTPFQPSFRAGRAAGNVSAGNVIVFSTVLHNIGSNYNSSNGRFTAPVAGRYLFLFNGFNTDNTDTQVFLRINGSNSQYSLYYGGRYGMLITTTVLNLNVNDYVDVSVEVGTVYAGGNVADCTFSGQLLS